MSLSTKNMSNYIKNLETVKDKISGSAEAQPETKAGGVLMSNDVNAPFALYDPVGGSPLGLLCPPVGVPSFPPAFGENLLPPEGGGGGCSTLLGLQATPRHFLNTVSSSVFGSSLEDKDKAYLLKLKEVIAGCGKEAHKWVHTGGCGSTVLVKHRCNSKWCLSCFNDWYYETRRRLFRVVNRMADNRGRSPKTIVLTLPNVPFGGLKAGLSNLKKCFAMLQRRKIWRDNVSGGVAGLGLTINDKTKTWHIHLHVLVESRYICRSRLSDVWSKITGGAWNVSIQKVTNKEGIVREIIKGTKGDMRQLREAFAVDSLLFDEAVLALHNRKWVWPFGNVIKDFGVEDDLSHAVCPHCESPFVFSEWSVSRVSLDETNRSLLSYFRTMERVPVFSSDRVYYGFKYFSDG